jgi:hypothetical protein
MHVGFLKKVIKEAQTEIKKSEVRYWQTNEQKKIYEAHFRPSTKPADLKFASLQQHYFGLRDVCAGASTDMIEPLVDDTFKVVHENMSVFG